MTFLGALRRPREFSFGWFLGSPQCRCGTDRWFFAKMFLHPEMDCHNHSNDGKGAQHQNRKQNLDHHRDSGYQNRQKGKADFPGVARRYHARMRNQSIPVNRVLPHL